MSEYMLSKDYFVQVIRDLIVLAEDRKEYFTDLDSAIGDGDHGINLSIGFREEFIAMMEKGVEIIKKRGKSTTGEKTMLDTFVPAVETLRKEYEGGTPAKEAMEKAVEAGKAGLESTRNIVATKGRAMRLGERAIGHLDPGAASAAEILEVFYKDMPN